MKNKIPTNIETPKGLAEKLSDRNEMFGSKYITNDVLNIFSDCHSSQEMERRCLNARVELTAADLVSVVGKAIPDGYNSFSADVIHAILFELIRNSRDGSVDTDALKTLDRNFTFEFGREGSPVLYIRSKHRWWLEDLARLERVAKADEFSVEPHGALRIWWD